MRRGAKILRYALRVALIAVASAMIALVGFHFVALNRERLSADASAPRGGTFVATREGRIHAIVTGLATGKPVLLIHGTGAWGGLWQETADFLGQRGYRAIAVDLPPFGFSDRPTSRDYSRIAQARRIVAVAQAMKLDRPALVGHSFGGGPATEAAMLSPMTFSKLVLVDPALGIDAPQNEIPLLARPQLLRRLLVSATATNMLATRTLLKSLIYRKDRALPRYVTILEQPLPREGTTAAYADWLPILLTNDPSAASAHGRSYRSLQMPMALIWGDKDTVTPLDQLAKLRTAAPQASVQLLRDVGHIPQIEDPAAFQTALLSALEKATVDERSKR
jgi:pimeloyl-ACP methyl ester carboxylesterase